MEDQNLYKKFVQSIRLITKNMVNMAVRVKASSTRMKLPGTKTSFWTVPTIPKKGPFENEIYDGRLPKISANIWSANQEKVFSAHANEVGLDGSCLYRDCFNGIRTNF
jgi:hypothetical protein